MQSLCDKLGALSDFQYLIITILDARSICATTKQNEDGKFPISRLSRASTGIGVVKMPVTKEIEIESLVPKTCFALAGPLQITYLSVLRQHKGD